MGRITVFLADRQVLFREGVHLTLAGEEDIDVIGEATENSEAFGSIKAHPPQVAILSYHGRGKTNGINIIRRIKQALPAVSVILVVDCFDVEQYFSAVKCGASACVTRQIAPDELVGIVRKVAGEQPD